MLKAAFEKTVGSTQLEVNFDLKSTFTALFGPSGVGKTTTLHCLSGLTNPDAGAISLNSIPLFDSNRGLHIPVNRRKIGFVFQDSRLFPHLTVERNLQFPLKFLRDNDLRFSLQKVINLLQLEHLLKRFPHSLSGGEAQRVAIGRARLTLVVDLPTPPLPEAMATIFLTSEIASRADCALCSVTSHEILTTAEVHPSMFSRAV